MSRVDPLRDIRGRLKEVSTHTKELDKAFEIMEEAKAAGFQNDMYLKTYLIRACQNEPQKAREVFLEVKEIEQQTNSVDLWPYVEYINTCTKWKLSDEADSAFETVQRVAKNIRESEAKLGLTEYAPIIESCALMGAAETLQKTLEDMKMKNIKMTSVACQNAYKSAIKACVKTKNHATMSNLYDFLKKEGVRLDGFMCGTFFTLFMAMKNHEKALEVYDLIKTKKNLITRAGFRYLLNACAKTSNLDKALEIYREMIGMNLAVDITIYGLLFNVCAQTGSDSRAIQLYDEMFNAGIEMNLFGFSTLLNVFAKVGNLRKALEIYREMLNKKIELNYVIYCTLFNACKKVCDLDTAMNLYREMIDMQVHPNLNIYNTLFKVCKKVGNKEKALHLYNEMVTRKVHYDSTIFDTLFKLCAKLGDFDEAMRLFEEMAMCQVVLTPKTYSLLIHICVRSGYYQRAIDLYYDAVASGEKLSRYGMNALLFAGNKLGDTELVLVMQQQLALEQQQPAGSDSGPILTVY